MSANVPKKRKVIMENILRLLYMACLTETVFCSIPRPLVFDDSWPGGARVHAIIRPPITVKSWALHLHFDHPVQVEVVWGGKVTSHHGRNIHVDIQSLDYDSQIPAGKEQKVGLTIIGEAHSGTYTTSYIPHGDAGASLTTTVRPKSTTATQSSTAASSTQSSSVTTFTTTTTATPRPTPTPTPTPTAETTRTTTPPNTTVPLVSTTTTQASSTTTPLGAVFTCDKFAAVQAVGLHSHASSSSANNCKDGVSGSNEDFVLAMCKVRDPTNWQRGPQVTKHCHQIPLYTPVATFSSSDAYSPYGAQSGLFVGCLPNGFKLITQHCGGNPVIEHVEQGGIFTQDPNQYFAIV